MGKSIDSAAGVEDSTYSLFVLAEGGMDDAHVEEDLAGVCDAVELG